jgi:hypothetical protein
MEHDLQTPQIGETGINVMDQGICLQEPGLSVQDFSAFAAVFVFVELGCESASARACLATPWPQGRYD